MDDDRTGLVQVWYQYGIIPCLGSSLARRHFDRTCGKVFDPEAWACTVQTWKYTEGVTNPGLPKFKGLIWNSRESLFVSSDNRICNKSVRVKVVSVCTWQKHSWSRLKGAKDAENMRHHGLSCDKKPSRKLFRILNFHLSFWSLNCTAKRNVWEQAWVATSV